MEDDLIAKAFKNESSSYLAVHLEDALERVVGVGLKFASKRMSQDPLWHKALENKAAPVIRGILNALNPEATKNIQGMDERLIWRAYWAVRNEPECAGTTIFELLAELNNNPPLTPVPA
ncbi:MAG: hypothetical protein Q8Q36_02365 [bacterium]|nr:hypothetical protein [bacterium]